MIDAGQPAGDGDGIPLDRDVGIAGWGWAEQEVATGPPNSEAGTVRRHSRTIV